MTSPRTSVRIGTVLGGRYLVTALLGGGGMGEVYEARHTEIGRKYAIKFLLPEFAHQKELCERFLTEARTAGKLAHVNIAAALDTGRTDEGIPYIVLEFLEGCDAQTLLSLEGPLPVHLAVDVVIQAARGLSEAHAHGIIHRDIKPANLFVTRSPDGDYAVKILDFGIAKIVSHASVGYAKTRAGVTLGTPMNMSPEQVRGASNVDPRSDVYSLTVVLYQLLTGEQPFGADEMNAVFYRIVHEPPVPITEFLPSLPDALVAVIERGMAKQRGERIGSMRELIEALAPFRAMRAPLVRAMPSAARTHRELGTAPPLSRTTPDRTIPSAPPEPTSPPSAAGRWRRLIAAGAALGGVALAAYALSVVASTRSENSSTRGASQVSEGGLSAASPFNVILPPPVKVAEPPPELAPPPVIGFVPGASIQMGEHERAPSDKVGPVSLTVPPVSAPAREPPSAPKSATAPLEERRAPADSPEKKHPSREQLEVKLGADRATDEELRLLGAICKEMADKSCVEAVESAQRKRAAKSEPDLPGPVDLPY